MYVGAVGMGFTTSDLESMPPDRLMWFIHCHNALNGASERTGPEYQEGTIERLKSIL